MYSYGQMCPVFSQSTVCLEYLTCGRGTRQFFRVELLSKLM